MLVVDQHSIKFASTSTPDKENIRVSGTQDVQQLPQSTRVASHREGSKIDAILEQACLTKRADALEDSATRVMEKKIAYQTTKQIMLDSKKRLESATGEVNFTHKTDIQKQTSELDLDS